MRKIPVRITKPVYSEWWYPYRFLRVLRGKLIKLKFKYERIRDKKKSNRNS